MLSPTERLFSWAELSAQRPRSAVLEDYGAYIVRLWDETRHCTRIIPRFLRSDPHGILYVGGTGDRDAPSKTGFSGRRRLSEAKYNDIYAWDAGWPYRLFLSSRLARDDRPPFPLSSLRWEFRRTSQKAYLESDILAAYIEAYGELPPLNGSITGKVREKAARPQLLKENSRAGALTR
jgi:hypothetical protein